MPEAATLTLGYRKGDRGTHCGVLYESKDGSISMLHLAGHRMLLSVKAWPHYMEIPTPRLLPAQRIAISDVCRFIFEKHGAKGLPYSAYIAQYFTPEGDLVLDRIGAGFTCTTFVADIFRTRGCALVDLTTWPPGNALSDRFFAWLVDLFRVRYPEDKAHFDAVADPDCKRSRLRAEELCAAASIAPPPSDYSAIKNRAKRLYKNLVSAYHSFD